MTTAVILLLAIFAALGWFMAWREREKVLRLRCKLSDLRLQIDRTEDFVLALLREYSEENERQAAELMVYRLSDPNMQEIKP